MADRSFGDGDKTPNSVKSRARIEFMTLFNAYIMLTAQVFAKNNWKPLRAEQIFDYVKDRLGSLATDEEKPRLHFLSLQFGKAYGILVPVGHGNVYRFNVQKYAPKRRSPHKKETFIVLSRLERALKNEILKILRKQKHKAKKNSHK